MKKSLQFIVVLALCLFLFTMPIVGADPVPIGQATISIEKFTLGLGYIIEPTQVDIYEGDTAADLTVRLAEAEDLQLDYEGTSGTFYLAAIRDYETRAAVIPQYIVDAVAASHDTIAGRGSATWLGEFDYTSMSGWMICVNTYFINVSAGAWAVNDGDVIRWQFTVYGYGADLGQDGSAWGGSGQASYITAADKDDLTARIAFVNGKADSYRVGNIAEAYDDAIDVLQNMEATQGEVDAALLALNAAIASPDTRTAYDVSLMTDVSNGHWAYANIALVMEEGLFGGVSATTFEPETSMTRAMFVMVLSRLNYADLSPYEDLTLFTDVPANKWYTGAVNWAASEGIVDGVGGGKFDPDKEINRQEMAKMIIAYAEYAGDTLPAANAAKTFTDDAKISSWAKDYVNQAQVAGLISGYSDGSYQPLKTATRAEVATIFARYLAAANQ